MRPDHTPRHHVPRHRAEVPRSARLADLRRGLAHLLAGRDLYADDRLLRPQAGRPDGSADGSALDLAPSGRTAA